MSKKRVVVIGSGPGGYVAAIRAAQLGHAVTIVEADKIGGVCLNVGCIPSKALITAGHLRRSVAEAGILGFTIAEPQLDFRKTQVWKNDQVVKKLTTGVEMLLKKNKVTIVKARATFKDAHTLTLDNGQTLSFDDAIIATGSRPIDLKAFPKDEVIIDSTGLLNLDRIPKHLVVIGGGYIGCELAGAFADLGSQVTIVESTDKILANFDAAMVRLIEQGFKTRGVTVLKNTSAVRVEGTGATRTLVINAKGKETSLETDALLVAVGRRPNTDNLGLENTKVKVGERGLIEVDNQSRTEEPNIYAIGDVTPGAALAHKASYEAKVVAEAISDKPDILDYKALPAVCFTTPEAASTGITLDEAKVKKDSYLISEFPWGANGRAISLNATEGFVRLISDKKTGVLTGAQIIGPSASDLITECTLAIESGLSVEDIALTIHPHPSLSEAVMDTAELAQGLPIHI